MKNQNGTALLIALGIMIMISLIGIAAITTTGIDIDISGSEKRSSQSLYLAEAGLQRAVYEYIWPGFNDENISPRTNLFGWIDSLAGDTIYQDVDVSGQGGYTVVVTDVNDPGSQSPFAECREVRVESHGVSLGGSENRTVVEVLRFGVHASSVFDYSYFMNHFGWWAGFPNGGAIMNGNTRCNGHYDLISGWLTVNGNPRYNPIDGEAMDNGGVYAGGIVFPLDGFKYQGMAQYAENRHSYRGVDNGFLDPAYVEMPNLNDAGDVDNDGNVQELNPYYLMLARGELELEAGRAGQDLNGDGVLQESEVVIAGCYGDEVGETGNVVLVGTSSNPIIMEGPLAVTGDFVVKGTISGAVNYENPPSERPTFDYGNETPEQYKVRVNNWLEENEDKDFVGFLTRESIILGNHPDSWWQKYIVGQGGWLGDYRNDGREDVGTDRVFGTMDNETEPYSPSEKERDSYWTVELYEESSGQRRMTDLQIEGGGVSVPSGWRVVPGSGEDVDGDGDYDDPYNYTDDINFGAPFSSANFHNMPDGVSHYRDLADFTVDGIDGALYTNHTVAGWLHEGCTVDG
ncbi:MAG: hypothetical protein AMJ41_02185, partial [candidate division Zixibacteria bacterium DG_27]